MAYVEDDKVVIHAFHEDDMERMFKKLGVWEAFIGGEMKCVVCDKELNLENFGALVPYKGKAYGACEGYSCISKAQKLVEAEAKP